MDISVLYYRNLEQLVLVNVAELRVNTPTVRGADKAIPVTRTASSGSGITWKASSAEIMADNKRQNALNFVAHSEKDLFTKTRLKITTLIT
ncbi:hypothetical protein C5167_020806 [Papaver somniferum]|uniref:Uncharacterized protein n=1 Tax=Papaver somniferum TaxID=3469 RepID=A0A4Y7IW47_PAPSO|nr:hypothetical protein C5167_020806 [Papaver somniferum]